MVDGRQADLLAARIWSRAANDAADRHRSRWTQIGQPVDLSPAAPIGQRRRSRIAADTIRRQRRPVRRLQGGSVISAGSRLPKLCWRLECRSMTRLGAAAMLMGG